MERLFVDHPVAQRLRYVGQSGFAHLVFPEVRTSRFSHSLGAMHLCSEFLSAALRNASSDVRADIVGGIRSGVQRMTDGYAPEDDEVVRRFQADGLLSGGAVDDEERSYVLLAEQGLRLAALFHDLGHLPFSHDLEKVFEDLFATHPKEAAARLERLQSQESGGLEVHERIGYRLAGILYHRVYPDVRKTPAGDAFQLAFRIAEKILTTIPPDDPALAAKREHLDEQAAWGWLHTLMAGELDVDRCDYLLRDARQYGLEFASFDLERLASNLVAVRPDPARAYVETAIRPQGLSAAESFLWARFRMYEWGIYHHKVAQVGAALRASARKLLGPALVAPAPGSDVARFLEDLETIVAADTGDVPDDVLDRFVEYDDIWLMTELRKLHADNRDDPWLALVCRRRRGPVSLWKRPADFPLPHLAEWNARLPDREDDEGQRRWTKAVADLAADGVLVVRHGMEPWKQAPDAARARDAGAGTRDTQETAMRPASALKLSGPEGTLRSITELTYSLHALRDVWAHDVQVFAFAADPAAATPQDVIETLNNAVIAAEDQP